MSFLVGLYLLYWVVSRTIYPYLKGYYIGCQLRKMRQRGIDPVSHEIFRDAKWGKHFAGVKKELVAKRAKVAVIVDVPLSLEQRMERIGQSWKR